MTLQEILDAGFEQKIYNRLKTEHLPGYLSVSSATQDLLVDLGASDYLANYEKSSELEPYIYMYVGKWVERQSIKRS